MGCNFYINETDEHIGKRSAAGQYCWDCRETLKIGGVSEVHQGRTGRYDACPICGAKPQKEKLEESSAGRELGFNERPYRGKRGVASCSSFTWAIDPIDLVWQSFQRGNRKWIVDEYGRKYTWRQFLGVLQECPVKFYDSIGKEFS